MFTNETLICKIAEDVEAGLITAESVLEVLYEKYNKTEIGDILQVIDDNGYQSVLDEMIIAHHNRLLKLHENMEFLEKCLELK